MQSMRMLVNMLTRERLISKIKKETSIIKKATLCIRLLKGLEKQAGIMQTKNIKVPLYYTTSIAFYNEAIEISRFLRLNNIIDRFRLALNIPSPIELNEWLYLHPTPKVNNLQEFYNLILPIMEDIILNAEKNSAHFEYYNRKLFPLMDTFIKISLILVRLK